MIEEVITVEYIDHMGSDLSVVNAARASFDKESTWDSETLVAPYEGAVYQPDLGYLRKADAGLLRYLATGFRQVEWETLLDEIVELAKAGDMDGLSRKLQLYKVQAQHWAPFAHPHLTLRLTIPIFLARQFVKHQVGGTWSEVSRRYVSDEPEFWFPQAWHARPEDIKQGSGNEVEDQDACFAVSRRSTERCLAAYQTMLAEGTAPEEARTVLPHNTMTTVVWTGSLAFWARVCNQRLDGHAQLAAQEAAWEIAEIVRPRFPVSWAWLVPGDEA